MATALITGASRGLGAALARELARQGWDLIVDARDGAALDAEVARWPRASGQVSAIAGDVTDAPHRSALVAAVEEHGPLDLLVNNASALGPSPLPPLATIPFEAVEEVVRTNLVAPFALIQRLLPALRRAGGTIVNVTSDAAVEPYEGWGAYASSKAGLDQLTAILAAEEPRLAVYALDPGDLRTDMHQAAFPSEDISDRPEPDEAVPAFLALLEQRPTSGRYTASELSVAAATVGSGGRP